ncbi:MAG: thioredoxin domain-containing protein [Phycisphaerae bacterium]
MAKTTKTEIRWRTWGQGVFDEARAADKLILLDSGATWCHWCHVMDHQTYEDEEVVRFVNERFIPLRIDRDRLPEVDARFQSAMALMSSQAGGWPLTAVVTPDGHVLFKATFLPPRSDPAFGAGTGLIELLETVDKHWRENRSAIAAAAARLDEGIEREFRRIYSQPGKISDEQIQMVFSGLEQAYDSQHGGFGAAPKFFNPPALELLEVLAWKGNEHAAAMLTKTLDSIRRGGVCDQVGGGFHRYSVDERWHVPHFEKMACDNAALLAIFANAHALTGKKTFRQVALQTMEWAMDVLGGGGRKGFFASQDADVGPEDDGDYFTWTSEEVRVAVGELSEVVEAYYDVDEQGDMRDRPGRNVLRVIKPPDVQARLLGINPEELAGQIEQGRRLLQAARARRPAPGVDKTVFADINGMMIDAFLTCHERLGEGPAREVAIATLDHLLDTLRDERGVFAHYRQGGTLMNVGLLADQAWMARAALHAFAVTGEEKYLQAATKLGRYIAGLATDFGALAGSPQPSTPGPAATRPAVGWEDSAGRSPASLAVSVLLDLGHWAGDDTLSAAATTAAESFAGGVKRDWALFLAGYTLALEHVLHGPRSILVVGPKGDRTAANLLSAARREMLPGGWTLAIDPSQEPQRRRLEQWGHAWPAHAVAYVCHGKACLAPAQSVSQLSQRLGELRKLQ